MIVSTEQAQTVVVLAKASSLGYVDLTEFEFKEVIGVRYHEIGEGPVHSIVDRDGTVVWTDKRS